MQHGDQADSNQDRRRVHSGEWRAVGWSLLYFFSILTAYYVMRPVREQLSAAVGSTQLPWFYAATFLATLLLTPLFGWLVSRWPRRVVVPLVQVFFLLCLVCFVPLFTHQGLLSPRELGVVFFVWVSVFNLFVVSVFWSFMADIWEEGQAKRLFPLIAVAGTAGAITGPAITRSLVDVIGVAPLLLVSAALLGVATGCVLMLNRWARVHGARRHVSGHEAAVGGGMFDGLKQVVSNPFMRGMAILLLLADGIGTVNYALVADYSHQAFTDAVARTRFAANMDLTANVLIAIIQLTLTRWLLPSKGPGVVISIWACVCVAVLALVIAAPDPHATLFVLPGLGLPMAPVVIALVISRALAYGMAEPARHSLYTRVPRSIRYKGQNAVDTAVWRLGDVSIALGMNALRAVGVGVAGFAGLSALAALTAAAIGGRLARRVDLVAEAPSAAPPAPVVKTSTSA